MQGATVQSARQFSGAAEIAVTPVTFKMRWNPNATAESVPPADTLPPQVDPRQMSLFGAAWTLGSLKALSLGGVDSVTYYETVDLGGVMASASGSPHPDLFEAQPNTVYPMHHVFAAFGAFRDGMLSGADSSNPLQFDGAALMHHGALCVLLANYSAQPVTVTLNGLSGAFNAAQLDATHARDSWNAVQPLDVSDGLPVTLPPYALMKLDVQL